MAKARSGTGIIAAPLNTATKYVVSASSPKLDWGKSILIEGAVAAKLQALKQQDGPMIQVHGNGKLTQTSLKNDLVDELWLKIFPITLGKGKRLSDEGTVPAAFKLSKSSVTPRGVIFANFERAPMSDRGPVSRSIGGR